MPPTIPDFITHYSRSEPFQSIMEAPGEHLHAVLSQLNEKNAWGLNRFSNQEYLKQRHEVEIKMRKLFLEIGGNPVQKHPIYFFLGRNLRFEQHPLNIAYSIKLSDVPKDSISFSYGDTMLSFNSENRTRSGDKYKNPLCEKLFKLDELINLFQNCDYPTNNPLNIEAHLWVQPTKDIVKIIETN